MRFGWVAFRIARSYPVTRGIPRAPVSKAYKTTFLSAPVTDYTTVITLSISSQPVLLIPHCRNFVKGVKIVLYLWFILIKNCNRCRNRRFLQLFCRSSRRLDDQQIAHQIKLIFLNDLFSCIILYLVIKDGYDCPVLITKWSNFKMIKFSLLISKLFALISWNAITLSRVFTSTTFCLIFRKS